MSIETWFRGEGLGVPPAKPGGHEHDFGDGMYLSDRENVAKVYAARRAATAADQQIFSVTVKRASLGRVLDLSADARWHSFMNDRTEPAFKKQSRLDSVNIRHELYGQFFREFLKRHKIDIKSYDAVIGPEYNLGGRQLCILHKNGITTKLHNRLRAMFRRVPSTGTAGESVAQRQPSPPNVGPPKVNVKLRAAIGRIRLGGRYFVRITGGTLVSLLLGLVFSKVLNSVYENHAKRELEKLMPTIDQELTRYTMKALGILSQGYRAYANIVVEISQSVTSDVAGPSMTSLAGIRLISVYVSHVPFVWEGARQSQIHGMTEFTSWRVSMSPELTFSKEQVEQFRATVDELLWYETVLANPVLDESDVTLLKSEKEELEKWAFETFGPFPPAPYGKEGWKGGYNVLNWLDID